MCGFLGKYRCFGFHKPYKFLGFCSLSSHPYWAITCCSFLASLHAIYQLHGTRPSKDVPADTPHLQEGSLVFQERGHEVDLEWGWSRICNLQKLWEFLNFSAFLWFLSKFWNAKTFIKWSIRTRFDPRFHVWPAPMRPAAACKNRGSKRCVFDHFTKQSANASIFGSKSKLSF